MFWRHLPQFQGKAPTPTDEDVYLEDLPALRVYVSIFGGYAHEKQILTNVSDLGTALKTANEVFNPDYFFFAGYDSPFRIFLRHNEVWL